jgi:hypothetical protein
LGITSTSNPAAAAAGADVVWHQLIDRCNSTVKFKAAMTRLLAPAA